MGVRPSGTVTFLFTDIEGSTRLWELDPDEMRRAVARHDELLRAVVHRCHGYVFSSGGDGLAAAFQRAADAVAAAVEAQRRLGTEPWPDAAPIRVRMSVHTGEAEERDGDYFGPALNRAARLLAIGHGGQVLVSHATEQLVREPIGNGFVLVDRGEHRLRDLSSPEHVFELRGSGAVEFPPLRSLDAFPGNLPLQVSSFIGRKRELARVIDAFDAVRVVTLTGVGGVGKTRLALQVAAEVLPRFREGAWLVEVAPVRDPDAVVAAFAATFAVTSRAGMSLTESLVEFLGAKRLVLVVDNCEHVLDAVAALVDVIERSCADVIVLATSREGLAVEGERVIPVPSLPGPPTDGRLEDIAGADAVRLFVERARAVDPDFTLTAENAAAVAQICRRLDGIPLAIELAAARTSAMNPWELARGLDHRFETLAGGRRRAVQRHQTLRAAIDWSYELCSEAERRVLARLAVFAGGCTRHAAETVCGGAPLYPHRVFELVAALVSRSLVVAERDRPDTRYRLLETIREYGEERLAEQHETQTLRDRHAEYYSESARRISEQITGPGQVEAGQRLLAEHENVLAAVNHAVDADNVDLALRLVHGIPAPQFQIGYTLGFPVEPILALTGVAEHPLYPLVLGIAASQAAFRGDIHAAPALVEQSLDAARRLGDPERRVERLAWNTRSALAFGHGATHDAARCAERAAAISRTVGRLDALAVALGAAATFHAMATENDAALPLATEGLALARQLGTPNLIVLNLAALAAALVDQDPTQARALLRESVELRAKLGYESMGEITQAVLISARLEDWPQTLTLAGAAIRHLHWQGDWFLLAATLNVVARALGPNDPEPAAVLQGAARKLVVASTEPLDSTVPAHSEPTAATTPNSRDFVTELRRTTTGLLKRTLGDARLRDLRSQGEAMDRDQTVAYALDAIHHANLGRSTR